MHVIGPLLAIGQFGADLEMIHPFFVEGNIDAEVTLHTHHLDSTTNLLVGVFNFYRNHPFFNRFTISPLQKQP